MSPSLLGNFVNLFVLELIAQRFSVTCLLVANNLFATSK